jgi:CBS domain-containing protein
MRRKVLTAEPETSLDQAVRDMELAGVGSVVVVNGELVVGIMTRSDLERFGISATRSCSACGVNRQLRQHPVTRLVLCVDCTARAAPAAGDYDLGDVD